MTSTKTVQPLSKVSWAGLPSPSNSRRHSTMSFGTSTGSNASMQGRSASIFDGTPRVQLVPYAYTHNHDATLSDLEREILNNTNFDELDLSSKDFDFEDIFTYGRPQRKFSTGAEASASVGDKEWSQPPCSQYSSSHDARSKVQRKGSGIGEMYVKNKSVARKK